MGSRDSVVGVDSAPSRVRRRGLVLAAVLVTLLVVMMVGAALTKALVAHHRQSRLAEQRQQAFWLAESALQRAVHALAKSPDYSGETWRVAADVLGGGGGGVAAIKVESIAEPQAGRRIRVEAYFPDEPVQRSLYQRELFVPVASSASKEPS
jgi:Tfp pilus assembly protein PilV